MVKGLTLRSLPMAAIALAAAGFATLAVDKLANSPALLAHTATPTAPLSSASTAGDLPDVAIETADGTRTSFAAIGGQLRIATLFYSHCPGVCPMTIEAVRGIERQLSVEQRDRLSFVLLSLDPARDSPAALRELARERGITSPRWLLGRTSENDARQFASAAHIQYRALSDGSIDHSTAIVLVDARGRLLARTNDAGDTTELVAAVRRAFGGNP
jgi:protein SCO1/2